MLYIKFLNSSQCVGLAFDALDKKPDTATRDLYNFIPLVRELGSWLSVRGGDESSRSSASSSSGDTPLSSSSSTSQQQQATGWGEILIRSGCVTKDGYEGRGLMTALNRFMMLEARARGYRAITVGVANWSIYRCWMSPPPGCRR